MANTKRMEEWRQVCEAYCKKVNGELLFVNECDFGMQYPDGRLAHIYADELEQILKSETAEKDGGKRDED